MGTTSPDRGCVSMHGTDSLPLEGFPSFVAEAGPRWRLLLTRALGRGARGPMAWLVEPKGLQGRWPGGGISGPPQRAADGPAPGRPPRGVPRARPRRPRAMSETPGHADLLLPPSIPLVLATQKNARGVFSTFSCSWGRFLGPRAAKKLFGTTSRGPRCGKNDVGAEGPLCHPGSLRPAVDVDGGDGDG